MENKVCVPLPRGPEILSLVPSREDGSLSTRSNERVSTDELVALAEQLRGARELVRGRALDRMHDIAVQMEHLQKVAEFFPRRFSARLDGEEGPGGCKSRRRITQDGMQPSEDSRKIVPSLREEQWQQFMSLLSPDEWNNDEKREEYRGSFRLEADKSWTPLEEVQSKGEKFARLESLLCGSSNTLKITYD